MTDCELLELAAKAAGIKLSPLETRWDDDVGEMVSWNPLEDDGDALRLAVKLRLRVFTPTTDTDVAIASCGDVRTTGHVHEYSEDEYSTDNLAATRRAIVRAAAEIGKGMK
tara:strand:- start:1062 stop:1394 length:333 start_codon:yes stop_codon:yes gene_type:complete